MHVCGAVANTIQILLKTLRNERAPFDAEGAMISMALNIASQLSVQRVEKASSTPRFRSYATKMTCSELHLPICCCGSEDRRKAGKLENSMRQNHTEQQIR